MLARCAGEGRHLSLSADLIRPREVGQNAAEVKRPFFPTWQGAQDHGDLCCLTTMVSATGLKSYSFPLSLKSIPKSSPPPPAKIDKLHLLEGQSTSKQYLQVCMDLSLLPHLFI